MNKLVNGVVLSFSVLLVGQAYSLDQSSPANSLVVDTDGEVGIGTDSPSHALHVQKSDAILKLEDTNGNTAKRFQVQLENNGGTGFLFTDNSVMGREWQVATLSNDSFTVSKIGTGGAEFEVRTNGEVKMGPGNNTHFRLLSGGNLLIPNGSVTATNFITSSSHTVKKDFEKLEASAVMDKLKTLEVTKWRYKDPEVKGQHIGPMAEDFYKLFELGPDNKHVVATDLASIALIASKELYERSSKVWSDSATLKLKTSALKADNEKLKKQLKEQGDRLASLERLVTNLALGSRSLPAMGKKVAFSK